MNCVQPHRSMPILATSGIDYNFKIWSPLLEDPVFDYKHASDVSYSLADQIWI